MKNECACCQKCKIWITSCKIKSFTKLEQVNRYCWVCDLHFEGEVIETGKNGPAENHLNPKPAGSHNTVSTVVIFLQIINM